MENNTRTGFESSSKDFSNGSLLKISSEALAGVSIVMNLSSATPSIWAVSYTHLRAHET